MSAYVALSNTRKLEYNQVLVRTSETYEDHW